MKVAIQNKMAQVEATAERIKHAQSVVVFSYTKMNAKQLTALRAAVVRAGNSLSVIKQNILVRALKSAGHDWPIETLTGQVAVAFGVSDAYQPIKAVYEATKDSATTAFRIGLLESKTLDSASLKQIATLPSRSELYAMFLSVLQAPLRKLLYAFKAVADTKSA